VNDLEGAERVQLRAYQESKDPRILFTLFQSLSTSLKTAERELNQLSNKIAEEESDTEQNMSH